MTTPNALVVMRGLRPGQATARLETVGGQEILVFGVREESRRIAALGDGNPKRAVETELRAGAEQVGSVLVVPAVLRLGKIDPRGENLYEVWLNAHATDSPSLLALAKQEKLVTRVFGDGAKLERTIGCPNSGRQFFVDALARATALPAWSMDDFDRARSVVEQRYPSVIALWNSLKGSK